VDSLLGIILVSISFQLPVAVLILTGLCSLPKDSPTRPLSTAPPEVTYRRIVLPSPARPPRGDLFFF